MTVTAPFDVSEDRAWWTELVALYQDEAQAAEAPARAAAHLAEAGRILAEHLGEPERAAALYREAHRADPAARGPIRALARLAERRHAWIEARRWLTLALEGAPAPTERVALLARLATVLQDHLSDRDAALRCLLEAVDLAPDDRALLLRLQLVAPADDPRMRLEVVQRLLACTPDRAERAALLLEMAEIHEQALEDDDEALRGYRAALEADPGLRAAFEGITRIHVRRRRWAELVTTLMHGFTVVEDDAVRGRLLYLCALVNMTRLGAPERARLFLGQAAVLLAHEPAAVAELVADYEQLAMWGPAGTLLESLAERSPPAVAAAAWYRVGLAAEGGLGQHERAAEAYRRALAHEPAWLPALAGLRRCAWRADDLDTYLLAVEGLAGAATEGPVRVSLLTHLADVTELRAGRPEDARRRYAAALAAEPGASRAVALPPALEERRRLLQAQRNWPVLDEELRRFLAREPAPGTRAVVRGWLAELYEVHLDRLEEAARLYEEVLADDPDDPQARRGLARLLDRLDDRRGLIAALSAERAHGATPSRALALLTRLGAEHAAVGAPDAAVAAWRGALEVRPDWLPARNGLGRLLYQHGRWSDLAALHQDELATLEPGDPARAGLLGRLAELYEFRLERPAAAAEAYEAVLSLKPRAPDALAGLERIYAGTRRFGDLARVLRARADEIEDPRDRAAIMFRLGELLHEQLDQPEEALDAYEVALTLWPDLLPAAWALERLVVARSERDRLVMLYRNLLPRLRSAGQRAVAAHKLAALLPPSDARPLLEEVAGGPAADASAAWALVREAAELGDREVLSARLAHFAQLVDERRDAVAVWREAAEHAEHARRTPADRLALWERLVPLTPEAGPPREALLRLHAEAGDGAELAATLVALARSTDDDRARSVALWRAGLLEEGSGREDLATQRYAEARAACAADPLPGWLLLGGLLADDARAALLEESARHLRAGPVAAADLYAAGVIHADRLGDVDRALAAFVEAVRRDPAADAAAERAAALLRDRRGFQELAALLERRIRRLDEPAALRDLLRRLAGVQLEALGDRRAAAETWARLAELSPDDLVVRLTLADLLFALERFADAAAHYARAATLADDEGVLVRIYTRLGQIKAHHLGDLSGAIEDLRRAVGLLDPEGRALEELAAVYLVAGEAELALLAYQRLEKLAESDDRASAARAGQVRALAAGGRHAEAVERLRAFRAADPVDPLLAALARDIDAGAAPARQAPPPPEPEGAVLAALRLRKVPTPAAAEDVTDALEDVSEILDVDDDGEPEGSIGLLETVGAMEALRFDEPQPPPVPADDPEEGVAVTMPLHLASLLPRRPSTPPAPPASPEDPTEDFGAGVEDDAADRPSRVTMPYGTVARAVRPVPPPPPPPPAPEPRPARGQTETGMPVVFVPPRRDDLSGLGELPRGDVDPLDETADADAAERLALSARERLRREPLDADAWQDLLRAVGLGPSAAAAAWLRGVVAWIDGIVRPATPLSAPGPLPEALAAALLPATVPPALLRLLRQVGPPVTAGFGGNRGRGAGTADEAVRPGDPLQAMAERVGAALGVQRFELARNASRPYTVSVEGGEPPRIVLGQAIVEGGDDGGRSFLLARSLVPLREGTLAARKLSDREFRAFLGALLIALGAEFPIRARDRATAERMLEWLDPALGDERPEGWAALARAVSGSLAAHPPATLRAGLEQYGARLALALCDGFGGAFEMLRLLDFDDRPRPALQRHDLEQFLADSEVARDLLLFAASPACLAVRAWLAGEPVEAS